MKKYNIVIKICLGVSLFIAVGVLLVTFVNFFINQEMFITSYKTSLQRFSEKISVLAPVNGKTTASPNNNLFEPVEDKNESLTLQLEYLEKLGELHSQTSNRDLFVFIYGFICSVLIGVSTYLITKGEKLHDELKVKYTILNETADNIDRRLGVHGDAIHFQFLSQVLSDAMISIQCYRTNYDIENLVLFKQNFHQVAEWCEDIDVSKIDVLFIDKFIQRLGNVMGVYYDTIRDDNFNPPKNPESQINDTHKKYIERDYEKIKRKFNV